MAGYRGYSMSNNAVYAYENGEKPLSKWTKSDIIESIQDAIDDEIVELKITIEEVKKLPAKVLKSEFLEKSSWHHTSNHYNRTDFYRVDLDRLELMTAEKIDNLIKAAKAEKKEEPKKEIWKCAFLEWSGTRKHPKATECVEVGEVVGNWFTRSDGSKKKTTANGFRFIEKIQ